MTHSINPFINLFNSNTGDVIVKLKNENLKLHSHILHQVPIFSTSLQNKTEIDLTGYDPSIKTFLQYLYIHKEPENNNDKIIIYYFCKIFCMEDSDKINDFIKKVCTDENVCDIINLAERLQVDDIVEYGIDYIVTNIRLHSIPCFDSYTPGEIYTGMVKDRKYIIPMCCKHGDFSYTYSHKIDYYLRHYEMSDVKPCVYYTLKNIYNMNDDINEKDKFVLPEECNKKLCCEHRDKCKIEFIDKLQNNIKDRILDKLIYNK